MPSGTMSNAIAIRAQTEPGDEVITQRHSHIYVYEEEEAMQHCQRCSAALVS